ncbi:Crp/Fnr family transcriptional regulator [Empedobacter brevis]|uniref:Crp/Fnr family transcriptional regulator n=1 Tax=Empedobacter brevis TaxID=247 RepID=UPI002FDF89DE
MKEDNKHSYINQIINVLNDTLGNVHFEDNEAFRELFKEKTIKKGRLFISEGDIPKHLSFIIKGIVKFYYIDNKGNEWIKHIAVENEFITAYGNFLHQTPSLYFIEAVEDTTLLSLSYETFVKLIDNSKAWSDIVRKFTEDIYYKKEIREAIFLKMDATERYLNFLKEYKHLVNRISIKEMASFLGISHVSLSRIRANIRN